MDPKALFHITYGLYLLTARESEKDNGCIINTVMQVAEDPIRIAISVLKRNKTHDMLRKTGKFNLSAITQEADFALFQRFGMQSGRSVDKFADFAKVKRSGNDLLYLTEASSMFLSATVLQQIDMGAHTLFIAEVVDGQVLSEVQECTYGYYQSDIKPKPHKSEQKRWVCRVCGYIYEGEEVPEDYRCPLCNHGKEDFELIR